MTADVLEEIRRLAERLDSIPDERPAWLKALDSDPTSVYYRYFYELTRRIRPAVTFEIGTCEGKSAAHLAAGHPAGLVITLDVKCEAKRLMDAMMLPNVASLVCDSLAAPTALRYLPSIDVLFIDGDHTLEQAYREYFTYRPHVRDGGLIFFDDISINDGMRKLWESIEDPKVALPGLHYTGFGAAMKDGTVEPRRA